MPDAPAICHRFDTGIRSRDYGVLLASRPMESPPYVALSKPRAKSAAPDYHGSRERSRLRTWPICAKRPLSKRTFGVIR